MEVLFIEAKYSGLFSISETLKKNLNGISDNIGLVCTVQFSELLPVFKKELEKQGKKVFIHGNGVILGCNFQNARNILDKVDNFVYIGSGKFHALQLALSLNEEKKIYLVNPLDNSFQELDLNEVKKFRNQKQGSRVKAMASDKTGILVSVKPGQCRLERALKLKEKLEKQGKKSYLFLMDNFQGEQFENWPKLAWINSACPGLSLDYKIANIEDF